MASEVNALFCLKWHYGGILTPLSVKIRLAVY